MELRDLLPPVVSLAVIAEHPCDSFMRKVELNELGASSSPDASETAEQFFAKLLDASQQLTVNRTILPTNRSDGGPLDDGAPLRKSAIADAQRKQLEDLRAFASEEELTLLQKALAALDIAAFAELTGRVLERVKLERVAA